MNLLLIGNTIKLVVDTHPHIKSYHFGYHSDINRNVPNVYDENNEKGTQFPHLMWVAPIDGTLDLATRKDVIDCEVYLYDLQAYGNDHEGTAETLLTQWNRLKIYLVEVLQVLYSKKVGISANVEWFTDANAQNDRLICVGARFNITKSYTCANYDPITGIDFALIDTVNDEEYAGQTRLPE